MSGSAPTHRDRRSGALAFFRALAVLGAGLTAIASCAPAEVPHPYAGGDAARTAAAGDADAHVDAGSDADADADADGSADADVDSAPVATSFAAQGRCPEGMASLGPRLCIDRWEASLVLVSRDGTTTSNPPNRTPDDLDDVRAVSRPGAQPQTYVSALQAEDACQAASKRLCSHVEWLTACAGSKKSAYPYGEHRTAGACNDDGRSPIGVVFPGSLLPTHAPSHPAVGTKGRKGKPTKGKKPGAPAKNRPGKKAPRHGAAPGPGIDHSVWTKLNDPRLGEVSGTFAKTGERALCKNELDVFDLVGNAHEWVSDELANGNGVFAGGYFQDVQINGEGCRYQTTAHARTYRDYSIGFRCCKDLPEP